jgi:hypothetical protein
VACGIAAAAASLFLLLVLLLLPVLLPLRGSRLSVVAGKSQNQAQLAAARLYLAATA